MDPCGNKSGDFAVKILLVQDFNAELFFSDSNIWINSREPCNIFSI